LRRQPFFEEVPLRLSLPDIIAISRQVRRALFRRAQKTRDAELCKRYLIIVLLAEGQSSVAIERHLKVARAHVSRTAWKYFGEGIAGLQDRREDNGGRKVDENFLSILQQLLALVPTDCGWERSSWSRELLVREMCKRTGVQVSRSTLGGCLRSLRARWGRTRARVLCPWRRARRQRRLRAIRTIFSTLKRGEEAFYVDEVDIDLNPRIGPDWTLPGQQRWVLTPGQNVKRFLAGALNHRTGHLVWVEGDQKRSWLFLNLLRVLLKRYRRTRVLHLILDNYTIHRSKIVHAALTEWGGRLRLHFLPPYCPDENRIERLWLQLHTNVTRNHRCRTIRRLLARVRRFLRNATPFPGSRPYLAKATYS
jgi:transposase